MFVYALFWDEAAAGAAVDCLVEARFTEEEISVLLRGAQAARRPPARRSDRGSETPVGGWGPRVTPAAGCLASGPVLACLEGLVVAGAGVDALAGVGVWHEDHAERHREAVRDGAVMVGVFTSRRARDAEEALQLAGAVRVHRRGATEPPDLRTPRGRLADDHRAIEEQLGRLASAAAVGSPSAIDDALQRLERRLHGHLEGEERYLLGPLADARPVEVAALRADHRRLLDELEALSVEAVLGCLVRPRIDALVCDLRDHARREDESLYRWADDLPEASRHSLACFLEGLQCRR